MGYTESEDKEKDYEAVKENGERRNIERQK